MLVDEDAPGDYESEFDRSVLILGIYWEIPPVDTWN